MNFKPKNIIKCRVCGKTVYSSYPGEIVFCDCKEIEQVIGIDETKHYTRFIGNQANIIEIKRE